MVGHEGGRWDVGAKNDAVYLERISESDERLFDDSLEPAEARELAGLLTKYADKVDKSDHTDGSDKSDDSDKSDNSGDQDKSEDSGDSAGDSDKPNDSEDSDKSSD